MFEIWRNFNHRVGVFLITELALFRSVIWRKIIPYFCGVLFRVFAVIQSAFFAQFCCEDLRCLLRNFEAFGSLADFCLGNNRAQAKNLAQGLTPHVMGKTISCRKTAFDEH